MGQAVACLARTEYPHIERAASSVGRVTLQQQYQFHLVIHGSTGMWAVAPLGYKKEHGIQVAGTPGSHLHPTG